MTMVSHHTIRSFLGATALGLMLAAGLALADSIFTPSSDGFHGTVTAGAARWSIRGCR